MKTGHVGLFVTSFSLGILLMAGCQSEPNHAPIVDGANANPDTMNLMQVPAGTAPAAAYSPAYAPAQQQRSYAQPTYAPTTQAAAPVTRVDAQSYEQQPTSSGEAYGNATDYSGDVDPYQEYVDSGMPAAETAPPPMPVYEQPEAPDPSYMWTPGYWGYAPAGYYWVPGAWIAPPYYGALWTPGWWGYYGNRYRFHHGYWGTHIGFYGGINIGFGYLGLGYVGGYWNSNRFFYNRAYNRVPPRWNNVYVRNVTINNTYINNSRVSYYGGPGGIRRAPMQSELLARAQRVTPPMSRQVEFRQTAMMNRSQYGARPSSFAAARPLSADRGITRPPTMSQASLQQSANQMRAQQQRLQMTRPNQQTANTQSVQRGGFQQQQFRQQQNVQTQQRQQMQQQNVQRGGFQQQQSIQQERNQQMQMRQPAFSNHRVATTQQNQAQPRQQMQQQQMQRQQQSQMQQRNQQQEMQQREQQMRMQTEQRNQQEMQQRQQQMQQRQQQQQMQQAQRQQQQQMQRQQQQMQRPAPQHMESHNEEHHR